MDVTLVAGYSSHPVTVELRDDTGSLITLSALPTFAVRVGAETVTGACDSYTASTATFTPPTIDAAGTYRAEIIADGGQAYPSARSPFTLMVRPSSRTSA